MSMNLSRFRILLFGMAFALVFVRPNVSDCGEKLSVSFASLKLTGAERVVGFEVTFVGAGIVSLPSVPMGWEISIDNQPSWNTRITASAVVGAAALDSRYFRSFIVIQKAPEKGLDFAISGTIWATEDFTTTREIQLKTTDVVLRKRK